MGKDMQRVLFSDNKGGVRSGEEDVLSVMELKISRHGFECYNL